MTSQSQLETAQLAAMHAQTAPSPLGIPSPLWTENQRLKAANADLLARVAELGTARDFYRAAWESIPTGAIFDYWDGSEPTSYDAKQAAGEMGEWVTELQRMVQDAMRLSSKEVQP